ncbi:putative 3-deoxy-D-manno-octulosonic acid transferase [Cucumis melo var. makuwa]|uniref:lipid IVA 3-deoxy-D-manno-octulosonic acid transferase n=1 Tax=Cucumis melo var. makuwa TaxID=1194695 RepID=A0A5D3C7W0_CUCMM|nr:putative 3-deoxy-D-manno-octulosonic acid transferase [Cucumis melo var. makuwa]
MAATKGKLIYKVYRALSYGLSPLLYLHLRWRVLRGLEHPSRWPERLGRPSHARPPGPLLWFHAVSLGEGLATIPVIKQCIQRRPDLIVLMTTTTYSAFQVVKNCLPTGVIYQIDENISSILLLAFAPLDTAASIDTFIEYWKPKVIILMESELWPNLILGASQRGIDMALLNARMSATSFKHWSIPVFLPLISFMLSKFSLILPLAIRFQLLQASPLVISFAGDLKFAVENVGMSEEEIKKVEDLRAQLAHRQAWMASSIHKGEEEVILQVHRMLLEAHPNLVTVIVPRHPQHGKEIALVGIDILSESHTIGMFWSLLAKSSDVISTCNIGELRYLYGITSIAVVGGSFLPGLAGHNISEAAAAGCAVLTGPYVGHFSSMVAKMQQFNPMSVLQVHGKVDLGGAIKNLLKDDKVLEAHRMAAKQAQQALASGIIVGTWNSLNSKVLRSAFG